MSGLIRLAMVASGVGGFFAVPQKADAFFPFRGRACNTAQPACQPVAAPCTPTVYAACPPIGVACVPVPVCGPAGGTVQMTVQTCSDVSGPPVYQYTASLDSPETAVLKEIRDALNANKAFESEKSLKQKLTDIEAELKKLNEKLPK